MDTLRGRIKPVMRCFDARMVELMPTNVEPMRSFVDKMYRAERWTYLSSLSGLNKTLVSPGGTPREGATAMSARPCRWSSSNVFSPGGSGSGSNNNSSSNTSSAGAILSLSCIHGFIAADVPHLGAAIIAVTDDDGPGAETISKTFGLELFALRGRTRPVYLGVDDAIDACLEKPATVNETGEARETVAAAALRASDRLFL